MTLFLIPGLDGSGILFEPFIHVLTEKNISTNDVCVLSYNDAPDQSISGLTQHITQKMTSYLYTSHATNDERSLHTRKPSIIVIAESFGGLMLNKLLQQQTQAANPFDISHAVFLACFLNRPSYISYFGKMPMLSSQGIQILKKLPDSLIAKVLFGKYANDVVLQLFKQSLEIDNALYVKRIQTIATLPPKKSCVAIPVNTPTLYLQAKHDTLVSRSSVKGFGDYKNFTVQRVPASHFLVETNPEYAVREILNFVS